LLDLIQDKNQSFTQLDAVFMTGDLAFGGKPDQYESVLKQLEDLASSARLGTDRIFIIPGNHDVDHEAIRPYHALHLEGMIKPGDSPQIAIDHVFDDASTLALLDEKFNGFTSGIPKCYSAWRGGRAPALVKVLALGDAEYSLRIGVVGLNSARFVSGRKTEDIDKGKLCVGRSLLRSALDKVERERPDVVFVLVHHPLDWLRKEDAHEVESDLQKRVDVVLFGHLHTPKFSSAVTLQPGNRQTLFLRAGALYDDSAYCQGVSFGRWESSSGRIDIRAFSRHQTGSDWAPEPNAFAPSQRSGRGTFRGAPRVDPSNRLAARVGSIELMTSSLCGGSDNLVGHVVGVRVKTDAESLKSVRSVLYTRHLEGSDSKALLSRDRNSGFAQTFSVDRPATIAARIEFEDYSVREITRIDIRPS
jgi:calcineurin-like phosphoesterase family protein